jgi:hypothetical protein
MTNYELYWNKGNMASNQYFLLSERQSASFTVDTTGINASEFHFYVQAVNECGKGPISDHLVVKRQTKPAVMDCISVKTSECTAIAFWKPRGDGE